MLFSGTGTIGETAVIEKEPSNWNIKEGVYAIKPNQTMIQPMYLRYILMTDFIKKEYMKKAAGGTVQSVPMGELKKIRIPVPSLQEQNRIVGVLKQLNMKKKDPEPSEMTFFEHIDALRPHLVRGVMAIGVIGLVAFFCKSFIIDTVLFGPQSPDFPTNRMLTWVGTQWAHIAEWINGVLGTSLDAAMSPDLRSLNATGEIRSANIHVQNIEAFDALAKALGNDELRKIEARDVAIRFAIKDGRITTQPFDLKMGGVNINLSGSTGLDQTIDYKAKVAVPGGKTLQSVGVNIGGTFSSPKITLGIREAAEEAVKNVVDEQIQKLTGSESLSEEIAKQAENLRAEAKRAGEKLIAAAQEQRAKLVEAAASKGALAKIAAEKGGDKLVQEAEKQAANLQAEAERQIEKLTAKKE